MQPSVNRLAGDRAKWRPATAKSAVVCAGRVHRQLLPARWSRVRQAYASGRRSKIKSTSVLAPAHRSKGAPERLTHGPREYPLKATAPTRSGGEHRTRTLAANSRVDSVHCRRRTLVSFIRLHLKIKREHIMCSRYLICSVGVSDPSLAVTLHFLHESDSRQRESRNRFDFGVKRSLSIISKMEGCVKTHARLRFLRRRSRCASMLSHPSDISTYIFRTPRQVASPASDA